MMMFDDEFDLKLEKQQDEARDEQIDIAYRKRLQEDPDAIAETQEYIDLADAITAFQQFCIKYDLVLEEEIEKITG